MHLPRFSLLLPLAVALSLLAGCGQASPQETSSPTLPPQTEAPEPTPTPTPTPEPTEAELIAAAIDEMLSQMTVEEKVGQMFLVRCPGVETALDAASTYHLGGYVLFASDFETQTPDSLRSWIADLQTASDIPMLISADEEGGTVVRVSKFSAFRSSPFRSPQAVYAAGGWEGVISDTEEKCQLLLSLGLNLNLAPVCDVSTDPTDFIYSRSFGASAQETAQYVETVVSVMAEQGMGSVLKHFPGYGSNSDTHTGIAYDDRPYETFLTEDFLPFQAGIAAGADAVLVAHNIVSCMDPDQPASLSPEVHRILREELGFDGVIITDDLAMEGIRDFIGDEAAAVAAVLAGNDLLCCSDPETQYPAVLTAVQDGTISQQRIDQSVRRILEMKFSMGLLTLE